MGMGTAIVVSGDLYFRRPSGTGVLDAVRAQLRDGDLFFGNLEAPFIASERPIRYKSGLTSTNFGMAEELAAELRPFSAVSIANNHVMDYGEEAYLRTMRILDSLPVGHAGGGPDSEVAARPWFADGEDGSRIAFLAYSCLHQRGFEAGPGTPGMAVVRVRTAYEPASRALDQPGLAPIVRTACEVSSLDEVSRSIREAARTADVVVVSIHWGVSGGNRAVVEYQYELGRHCVDAGAAIVFGHHPHVLQPVEFYHGGLIAYSMGNLVFDSRNGWTEPLSAVLRCYVNDGKVCQIGLIPIRPARDWAPVPAADDETISEVMGRLELTGSEVGPISVEEGEVLLRI